jgi:hypothetical protein
MALESIRTRNQQVIHAVEKGFSDPRNWRTHQINEVREKPQEVGKSLELTVP